MDLRRLLQMRDRMTDNSYKCEESQTYELLRARNAFPQVFHMQTYRTTAMTKLGSWRFRQLNVETVSSGVTPVNLDFNNLNASMLPAAMLDQLVGNGDS